MNNASYRPTSWVIACGLALLALPVVFAGDIKAKIKSLDSDGDGRVSRAEHAAGAKRTFERIDANHDGIVTVAEMRAAGDQDAYIPAPGMSFALPTTPDQSAAERFKALDADGDGKLTATEHAAGSDAMFVKLDANSDGYLSPEELAAGTDKAKQDK